MPHLRGYLFLLTALAHTAGAVAGTELAPFRHEGAVVSVAFSPDGTALISQERVGAARLWDVTTGKALRRFGGEKAEFWRSALSADGRTLASIRGGIRLWDAATGKELRHFPEARAQDVALSPDNKTLAVLVRGAKLSLWDQAAGKELHKLIALKAYEAAHD